MLIEKCVTGKVTHYKCICEKCEWDYDTLNKKRTKFCFLCDLANKQINRDKISKSLKNFFKNNTII